MNHLLFISAAILVATQTASAVNEGLSSQNLHYFSTGIGEEERRIAEIYKNRYNLWVTIANKKNGQYYSGAKVRIFSRSDLPIIETLTDGPWLFANLNTGRYSVQVSVKGKTQTKYLNVWRATRTQELVFYFDN